MRARTILTAALLAGISVACSKPAPEPTRAPDQGNQTDERQIRLVDAPSHEAPVVSALEAGIESRLTPGTSTPQQTGRSRMVAPAASSEPEAALPSLALTEVAAPVAVSAPSTALPVGPSRAPAPAAAARGDERWSGPGGTRGPVILIRGGMGTADDDCKLHPVASRGRGIAINSIAPPIPGRVAVNNQIPRGNGGFTRIR